MGLDYARQRYPAEATPAPAIPAQRGCDWLEFGIFTLVAPTGRGEIVQVSIPIGKLVSRAVKGVSASLHRRQEPAARREVEEALTAFAAKEE